MHLFFLFSSLSQLKSLCVRAKKKSRKSPDTRGVILPKDEKRDRSNVNKFRSLKCILGWFRYLRDIFYKFQNHEQSILNFSNGKSDFERREKCGCHHFYFHSKNLQFDFESPYHMKRDRFYAFHNNNNITWPVGKCYQWKDSALKCDDCMMRRNQTDKE